MSNFPIEISELDMCGIDCCLYLDGHSRYKGGYLSHKSLSKSLQYFHVNKAAYHSLCNAAELQIWAYSLRYIPSYSLSSQ